MEIINTAFLALIQGITEFLPISSSAHLILGRHVLSFFGFAVAEMSAAEELALDIALHVGTLGAVIVYFWRDIGLLLNGFFDGITGKGGVRFQLLLRVIVASIPIMIGAFLAKDFIIDSGRSIIIIGWTTLIFGMLLYFADKTPQMKSEIEHLTYREAIIIGIAQLFAIIPGVSRSGICMTAARYVGLDRQLSARLAMLLSIPTILGAGLLAALDMYKSGNSNLTSDALIGGLMSFAVALAAITLLMNWLKSQTYTPFVIYRIILGVIILGMVYSGFSA